MTRPEKIISVSTAGDTGVWCDCVQRRVRRGTCDCTDDFGDDLDVSSLFEDPPLYPLGKLAGMSLEELEREHEHQCDRQGRLGDAEHIDDRAVEETEMRCRAVEAEIKRRKEAA